MIAFEAQINKVYYEIDESSTLLYIELQKAKIEILSKYFW